MPVESSAVDGSMIRSLPLPKTALDWFRVFGPDAVVASLTIGMGELIFSTRGGALSGSRILFVFVAISVLKTGRGWCWPHPATWC